MLGRRLGDTLILEKIGLNDHTTMGLCARIVDIAEISARDRQKMLELMGRHYFNVVPSAFDADLAEKQWVIQVFDPATAELCGFSTQMVLNDTVDGRAVRALFSGDTIIDRQFWGDSALMQAGGRLALSLVDESPCDLYWFLISQGYKTYRFLPMFFRDFYPRFDVPTPPDVRRILDTLAEQKFSSHYNRGTGIVRADVDQYSLREGVADVSPGRLRDPHIRFFVEQNPGHASGDEPCRIAPLHRANFTSAALRVLRRER